MERSDTRGFSLTDGGYYFAISDYFDFQIKGSIYANGSWLGNAETNYKRLYKYSGNLSFSYANNITGHYGLSDYTKSNNYRLSWSFNQDAKASPGSRFTASVNMSSSGYDQNNSYNVNDHITTQRQSSISYSKSWDGTPFNLSMSANHSQNVKTKSVSLNLPRANFSMGRIYPFKSQNSSGPTKWYQEIQLSYTASLDNQIDTKDSLLFTSSIWKHMRNGFKHEIPVSFQLRPFKNFSISPSLTYTGVLYTQKIRKNWNPAYNDVVLNTVHGAVVNDTLHGFFYGQAVNPSISASFNPQIFGTYDFTEKSPNSRLQQIRHVIKPSVGFSFTPSFAGLSSKMYRQVQIDTNMNYATYSIYEGNIFGTPSLGQKSGNVSFSLVNLLEAKVFARNDTTGKAKKIKLIDNFSINTSYNIFADSLRWAPISMQMRTSILNNVNISANSSFTLYGVNPNTGQPWGKFLFQDHKLMRLTNFNAGVDFSLSDLLKKKDKKTTNTTNPQNYGAPGTQGGYGMPPAGASVPQNGTTGIAKDAYGYPVFDVPWTLNMSYSLSYVNSYIKPTLTQTLSFNGGVTFTKKMSVTYTSGYDFTAKKITMTNIGITRDLHCWEMNLNWIPNGTMQSWNFTIRVKASVLGDLKYERRKDFHDPY